jgi:methylmalonyl-CoA epimerase
MITNIYSVTIAVKDLAKAVQNYEAFLGINAQHLMEPEAESTMARFVYQRHDLVDIGFDSQASMAEFCLPGGARVILISSPDENSVVGNFLAKRGEGLMKVSLRVDDAKADVNRIRDKGLALILDKNALGHFGETNFIHPKTLNGVEFELFEPKGSYRA